MNEIGSNILLHCLQRGAIVVPVPRVLGRLNILYSSTVLEQFNTIDEFFKFYLFMQMNRMGGALYQTSRMQIVTVAEKHPKRSP